MDSLNRGNIENLIKKHNFSLYGSWEDLVACKILLWDVGIICPPGKPNYDNLFSSVFCWYGGGTILDDFIEFAKIAP